MAADGGDSASFTVRLINQISAPARQVQQSMAGMTKSIQSAQRALAAPAPKRGAVSDWEKMTGGAKRNSALEYAKNANRLKEREEKRSADVSRRIAQGHADHGLAGMLASGGSEMALGATVAVAAAGLAAAAAVGYMGLKFAEASVQAGIFAERSTLAIGFLTNNAPAAAQQFDAVRHMAQGLGLDVEDTQHSFQRLLAAQFSVGQSKELIKMGSDLQAIGASADEVSGALLAITQIKSKGRLQAQEMLQLQERGISAELVYGALQKNLGKSKAEVQKMQTAGKITGDDAIQAITDAVKHKTHESKLGEAGAAFASQTVAGMTGVMHAKLENLFVDVGELMMPGVTKIMKLVGGMFDTIVSDPKIIGVGQFLLSEFEYFTLWVDANWPAISAALVTGAELVADSFRFVVELFDTSTVKGMVFAGVIGTLAAAFGVMALAGFTLMLPLYALIAVIGAVAYGIYAAIGWISEALSSLGSWISGGGDKGGGVGNDNGIQPMGAAGGFAALAAMQGDTTESAAATGQQPINLTQHITVPQADDPQRQAALIGQEVHSQIATIMRQAS